MNGCEEKKGRNEQSKANVEERKTKRDTVRPGISWLSVDDKQVVSIQYSQLSKCSKQNKIIMVPTI